MATALLTFVSHLRAGR